MSKYSELAQKREAARRQHQRRELWRALRHGRFDGSPVTYTVRYDSKDITISEAEYLWLKLRGHLQELHQGPAMVIDTHHLELKEHHHAQPL